MPELIAPYIAASLFNLGVVSSVGAAATISSIAAPLVMTGAVVGAQIALTPRPDLPQPSDGAVNVQQPIPPRTYAVGEVRLAGKIIFLEGRNAQLYQVNALYDGDFVEVLKFYLFEDIVTLDSHDRGEVVAAPGGHYVDVVNMGIVFGVHGVNAIPPLSESIFPDIYASAYGTGVSLLWMFCGQPASDQFLSDFPNGKPNPSVALRTTKVWDPRDDAQDPNDPATWAYSRNAALCWLWYECFCPHGPLRDVARAILPVVDLWNAAADICDEECATAAGGTVPRYAINYFWDATATRESVRGMFAAACDGNLYELPDGTIILRVGKYIDSGIVITDDDIRAIEFQTDIAKEDRINELTVRFTYPDQNYGAIEADPIRDDDQIALDGEVLSRSIDLWQVQELNQAKRLALRSFRRNNEGQRGTIVLGIGKKATGLRLLAERWATIQSNSVSRLANLTIEITGYRNDVINGLTSLDFVRSGSFIDDYDPNDPKFGDGELPPPILAVAEDPIQDDTVGIDDLPQGQTIYDDAGQIVSDNS